jgi:hypothetical protein
MKIEQHDYLSAEAKRLRQRDGVPPWGVHPCEVESLRKFAGDPGVFGNAWREADRLRREIEA